MRRRCASLCLLLLGSTWAFACGSDRGSPASGNAGESAGGALAEAGAATYAGESSGGTRAIGGAPAADAGASSDAGAGDPAGGPSGGAGGAPSPDYGQLLFDSPGVGAIARGDLFRASTGLVWLYELEG